VRPRLLPARAVISSLVVLLLLVASCATGPEAGPIDMPNAHGWSYANAVVGQAFTDGFETLGFATTDPVVVTAVHLEGDPELQLDGVLVADGTRRVGAIQFDDSFPPTDPDFGRLTPLLGRTLVREELGRHDAFELVLGLSVTRPGAWRRTGVRVDYMVGSEEYSAVLPAELTVCTEGFEEECAL
jgi:hypothetical protein